VGGGLWVVAGAPSQFSTRLLSSDKLDVSVTRDCQARYPRSHRERHVKLVINFNSSVSLAFQPHGNPLNTCQNQRRALAITRTWQLYNTTKTPFPSGFEHKPHQTTTWMRNFASC
jgi:hypothetical protein